MDGGECTANRQVAAAMSEGECLVHVGNDR